MEKVKKRAPMGRKRITRGSHSLSRLLRFTATRSGLEMDPAGWVSLKDVLRITRLSAGEVEVIVGQNNKARFQLEGERIRACQGHGSRLPVDPGALEHSWERYAGADGIWHGTNVGAVEGIARQGILPGDRTHVHMAAAPDSRVGKRANVALLLEVSVAALARQGLAVHRSPNGVLLVRRVPPDCMVGLRCLSRRAREEEPRLRRLLGLATAPAEEGLGAPGGEV